MNFSVLFLSYWKVYSSLTLCKQGSLLLTLLVTVIFSFNAGNAFGAINHQAKIESSRHITLLDPKHALKKIRANHSRILVVLFSSFDRRCKSCSEANQRFYQLSKEQQQRYDFVFVNTMPWAAKELETSLHYRVNIRHPATMLFYKGRILKRVIGSDYTKMPKYLSQANSIISAKQLALYGMSLSGSNFNEVVISDKYRKFLDKYIASKRNFKALAVAVTRRSKWTASQKTGYSSQQQANTQALKQCNERWQGKGNKGSCKLYMVGNRYVYNNASVQIDQTLASNLR
jgi:hypothetical protein